jgi:hypothetical protein
MTILVTFGPATTWRVNVFAHLATWHACSIIQGATSKRPTTDKWEGKGSVTGPGSVDAPGPAPALLKGAS